MARAAAKVANNQEGAPQLRSIVQGIGYKNVCSMAGGLNAWRTAGLPTAKMILR
jgi:rhodanese-related sulfurtransferase